VKAQPCLEAGVRHEQTLLGSRLQRFVSCQKGLQSHVVRDTAFSMSSRPYSFYFIPFHCYREAFRSTISHWSGDIRLTDLPGCRVAFRVVSDRLRMLSELLEMSDDGLLTRLRSFADCGRRERDWLLLGMGTNRYMNLQRPRLGTRHFGMYSEKRRPSMSAFQRTLLSVSLVSSSNAISTTELSSTCESSTNAANASGSAAALLSGRLEPAG